LAKVDKRCHRNVIPLLSENDVYIHVYIKVEWMVCLSDRSGFRTGAIIAQHTPDFTSTGMLDHQKRFLFRAAKRKA
jgi:hypothetical protein